MSTPIALAMAAASSCLYFLGIVLFRNAAAALPPLRGTRPVHFAVSVLTSSVWLAGGIVMAGGMALQFAALTRLSLAALVPALLCGLVVLVLLPAVLPGERLSRVELSCLAVMASAGMVIAWSGPGTPPPVPAQVPVLLAVPSLVIPVLIFSLGDARPEGQHARPLTGIAYGLSAGILIGLAELALGLLAREGLTPSALATPLPYLFALAVACGIAQIQIGLQRCRMIIMVFVATVVAKVYLVVTGGLLCLGSDVTPFSAPWLLVPGLVLLSAVLFLTPRYETSRQAALAAEPSRTVTRRHPGPPPPYPSP
ncbi:hypothetical protein ABGB12_28760 [Actinocorallia sp. B10E7]|uniref:hypothetical protein n=1 Tax=Actinocorallia sp. B10E7 TaxID=3153558 RepID=UPI00325E6DF3